MKQAGLIYYLNQPVLNLVSLVASNKIFRCLSGKFSQSEKYLSQIIFDNYRLSICLSC